VFDQLSRRGHAEVSQMNFENTVDFDIKDDPEGGEDFVKVGNVYHAIPFKYFK
jgi:hypothetical protein